MSSPSHSLHRSIPPISGDGTALPRAGATVIGPDGEVIAAVFRRSAPGGAGREVIVSVEGDLDLDTAPLAQAILIQALDGDERVCLDLSEVHFFGAAGLGWSPPPGCTPHRSAGRSGSAACTG